ncbi:hypothetical protein A4X13_0g518 [Tilletia indica]|uniref:Uncharacterized protein n=1 Tax=Tilletia indica TaxID=43049 RepID=A0A8T8TGF4_9BASI|nr:hypothetical protein A4X13_0g518 [Tilletia indica]
MQGFNYIALFVFSACLGIVAASEEMIRTAAHCSKWALKKCPPSSWRYSSTTWEAYNDYCRCYLWRLGGHLTYHHTCIDGCVLEVGDRDQCKDLCHNRNTCSKPTDKC